MSREEAYAWLDGMVDCMEQYAIIGGSRDDIKLIKGNCDREIHLFEGLPELVEATGLIVNQEPCTPAFISNYIIYREIKFFQLTETKGVKSNG